MTEKLSLVAYVMQEKIDISLDLFLIMHVSFSFPLQ
jgi:hypothetical protein